MRQNGNTAVLLHYAQPAYARDEPALIEKLLEVRRRLVEADLGEGIATPFWAAV